MTEYDYGETAVISCEVKDENGVYVAPATIEISILRNSTTLVNEVAMTTDATGQYHYDYLTTLTGRHDVWIKVSQTSPDRITIKPDSFEVIPSY